MHTPYLLVPRISTPGRSLPPPQSTASTHSDIATTTSELPYYYHLNIWSFGAGRIEHAKK